MNLPGFLTEAPFGEIRLTGHRIGLYHVVKGFNDGKSPEALAEQYPTLPLALIYAVIAFYVQNRVEVDEYVARVRSEIARQVAELPKGPTLAELKQRLADKRRAESA